VILREKERDEEREKEKERWLGRGLTHNKFS
jgi:hypothetical protein